MPKRKLPKHIRKKKNKQLLPYSSIILAIIIWSGALPVIKITTGYVPPFTFLLFRFALVCTLMLPAMYMELKRTPIHKKDFKNLILLGLAGQSAIALIFWGVKYTTALDAAIIGTLAPLLTIAAGHYFYNDRISKTARRGILLATLGMLAIVLEPALSQSGQSGSAGTRLFGNLLVVLYNISFTLYIVWSKAVMGKHSVNLTSVFKLINIQPMRKSYSPVLHTSFAFYVGLATIIPFAILENMGMFGSQTFSPTSLTSAPILGILYMAVLSSIVAYIAYEWGLKNAEVADGGIFGYLGPLFTLPFAYLILAETPTSTNLIGSGIIALGVIIAEKERR